MSACALDAEAPDVERRSDALELSVGDVWPTPLIPVCWENASPGNDKERGWVLDEVTKTWESYSAVVFEGWGDCNASSRGIRLRIADGLSKQGVGMELDGVPSGLHIPENALDLSAQCLFPGLKEQCVRIAAAHQFGHALGFEDEHADSIEGWQPAPLSIMQLRHDLFQLQYFRESILNDADEAGVGLVYGSHGMYSVAAQADGSLDVGNRQTLTEGGYFGYADRRLSDVNGDGFLDYVAISGEVAYVVPGNADGLFDHELRQYMDDSYFTYEWRRFVDVNNDGFVDFVAVRDEFAYVVPGTASGRFDYDARQYMNAVYFKYGWKRLADVNGDGFVDFVSVNDEDDAYVVPGTASGRFDHDARQYMTGVYFKYGWKQLADVNGDGFLDFVSTNDGDDAYVVPGTASGRFDHDARQYMSSFYFKWSWKQLADVNGDGFVDFVSMNEADDAYVVPGTASGRFDHDARQYMNSFYFKWPWKQLADVNGDGFLDFVAANEADDAYVVPGTASGRFDHDARQYMNSFYFEFPWKRLADVNGDGFLDFVAVRDEHAYVVPGTASGRFEHDNRHYSRSRTYRLAKFLDDVDGDGNLELLTFK